MLKKVLGPHSCTGLRENRYGPVKKREFGNSTLTTPIIIRKYDEERDALGCKDGNVRLSNGQTSA